MKYFILIAMMVAFTCQAQTKQDTLLFKAGQTGKAGFVIVLVGSGIAGMGATMGEQGLPLMVLGSITAFIGHCLTFSAWNKVQRASGLSQLQIQRQRKPDQKRHN
jgi:hypothetical protein